MIVIIIDISLQQLFMLIKDVVFTLGPVRLREVRRHHDAAHRGDQAARREHHQQEPAAPVL